MKRIGLDDPGFTIQMQTHMKNLAREMNHAFIAIDNLGDLYAANPENLYPELHFEAIQKAMINLYSYLHSLGGHDTYLLEHHLIPSVDQLLARYVGQSRSCKGMQLVKEEYTRVMFDRIKSE